MAESKAISGFGATFGRGDGASPEVFTNIAEVRDITGPGLSRGFFERTHQESPGRWREKLPALRDGGQVTFELGYIPTETTHKATGTGVLADFQDDTVHNYKLTFSDGSAWILPAFVANFEPASPREEGLIGNVTYEVAGQPTLV